MYKNRYDLNYVCACVRLIDLYTSAYKQAINEGDSQGAWLNARHAAHEYYDLAPELREPLDTATTPTYNASEDRYYRA